MPKFSPNKGAPNQGRMEDELQPPNTNPWDASASRHGRNKKFDDDAGTYNYAGHGVGGAGDNEAFLRASDTGPDIDAPHQRLSGLIDDSQPYDPVLTGGAPLTRGKGIGPGSPRHAPKNLGPSSQKNWDSRGGRDRTGGR
jgi:hypothetical protein